MAKLKFPRDVIAQTKDRAVLNGDEAEVVEKYLAQNGGKGAVHADPADLPMPFLRALLADGRLAANHRAAVAMRVHGMNGSRADRDVVYDTPVTSPNEFGSTFSMLGTRAPNCEYYLNGRWYPATLTVQFLKNEDHLSKYVILQGSFSICEMTYSINRWVAPDMFLDDAGQPVERSVIDVLQGFGFRRLQTPAADFNLKLVRAERAAREGAKLVLVSGPGMGMVGQWWPKLESRTLGTPEVPRKCIIEPDLEVPENQRTYQYTQVANGQGVTRLPFVRVFSLDTKSYVYADVDDVTPYDFDEGALSRLHLPGDMLTILTRVFNTPVEGLFGDLIQGKHGGVVVLASGKPGVGKTLTAEVYAETTRRPLYVLELGELGTNVAQVEQNLGRVFTRVAHWNAVLQFDECEIFLARRGDDLERSAIVGSFLRLLDYYRGILFLTSNRPEVLDPAVLSRVMLKLEYPDLDRDGRAVVWRNMLEAAGMTLTGGTFEQLGEFVINGRQIRNLTRLARILYPDCSVSLEQMVGVMKYGKA